MGSGFITRVEHGKDEPYTVIFTTDDEHKYKAIEDACRFAIGHGKPQFQPVVRCGECKHFIGIGHYCKYCRMEINKLDGFCSYGKRKEKTDAD